MEVTDLFQRMYSYIQTFDISIADIVDVAIIAVVIYRLLLLVRRSRAAQVVKAILLLLAALALSSFFQLRVINFFLSHMVEMGMLALIVVFQPEIRRFLEQLGSTSLGDVFSREEAPPEVEEAIAQTVQAYAALSRDKVGALMVFERKVSLDDIIKTGTALDSTVAAELLKNLFWNKAPLHDGAVIVRNGHIVGAGCVLPLSGNINHAPPGRYWHERKLRRCGGHRLRGDGVHLRGGKRDAQAAPGPRDAGAAAAQRAAAQGDVLRLCREALRPIQVEKR